MEEVDRSNQVLRLDQVSISNFRCFTECEFEMHPQLTVFVADNGKGKTALLEAMCVVLESVVAAVDSEYAPIGISKTDIRLAMDRSEQMTPQLPVDVSVNGDVNERPISWSRRRNSAARRRGEKKQNVGLLQGVILSPDDQLARESLVLPLIAYYEAKRTARIDDNANVGVSLTQKANRISGYHDCFDPIGSFSTFVKWYRSLSVNLREKSLHTKESSHKISLLLASVNDAVRIVLKPTEWSDLQWDYDNDMLTVAHSDGIRLPASMLSDGVRTCLAIVADLAHRCCRLNPQFGVEARWKTPGIALIDEIDLHLHPGWQQQISDLLQDAFPKLQFILTTHSPQVLSTVDHKCIRIIRVDNGVGDIGTPMQQTLGVESADILAKVMGVDPIPKVAAAKKLSDYRALLTTGEYDSVEAEQLWSELLVHFGEDHPIVEEVNTLRRFQEFKRANNISLN